MSTFPFYLNGTQTGQLDVERDGLRYLVTARIPQDGDNVYRAYAKAGGLGGAGLLISTMQPDGNEFIAKRMFTRAELADSGILADLIDCGVALPAQAEASEPEQRPAAKPRMSDGWKSAERPEELVNDKPLKACLKNAQGILYKENEDCVFIAAPMMPNRPFALNPAFSIVRPTKISGKNFGIIKIDNLGVPCIIR